MNRRNMATVVLAAHGVVLAHITMAVGITLPWLVESVLRVQSIEDAFVLILPIGRFAHRFWWGFAALYIVIPVAASLLLKAPRRSVLALTTLALSVQSAVFWCFAFCCSYFLFCMGLVRMHRGPTFDGEVFRRVGFGVFPASFIAIAAVFGAACAMLIEQREEMNAQQRRGGDS